jgi:hypothetical protein
MAIFGYICLIVAAIWITYKVCVSYTSFGGTVMVTVYDAAIYPPFIGAFGLFWVFRSLEINWPIWTYCLVWIGLTAFVVIAIRIAEDFGDRRR